jgi:excisionase family DNA binding protein
VSTRLPPGAAVVLTPREAALLHQARGAIVDHWRGFARGVGVPFPRALLPLLDELAVVALNAGFDLGTNGGTATGSAVPAAVPLIATPVMDGPTYMSSREAAERLSISTRAIRKALASGRLAGRQRGGRAWEVEAEAVERYRQERAQRRAGVA